MDEIFEVLAAAFFLTLIPIILFYVTKIILYDEPGDDDDET